MVVTGFFVLCMYLFVAAQYVCLKRNSSYYIRRPAGSESDLCVDTHIHGNLLIERTYRPANRKIMLLNCVNVFDVL